MDTRRETDIGFAHYSHPTHTLYRQLFDHAPYGLFIAQTDKSGAVHFPLINDNAAALLNAGMHCEYPDYATGLKFIIKTITAQAPYTRQAIPLEREDKLLLNGKEQRIKTLLTPIYDESGNPSTVVGVIDDISGHKSRDYLTAIREVEFRSIAERVETGIVRFDTSFRRIYVNQYVAKAYGLETAELIGTRPSDLPGGKSGELYEASIREVFETGRYVEYNHDLNTGGGHRLCRMMLFPEWLPDGKVGSVLAVGQSQDDSQGKLKLLPDAAAMETLGLRSSNVILCFSSNGQCIYLNESADELLQESGQASQSASLLTPDSSHPFMAASHSAIRQLLETGESIERELVWSYRDGRHRHYRARYLPKLSAQGEIISILAIASRIESPMAQNNKEDIRSTAQHEVVREAERHRIALEIHDELGQLLTALRFRLAMLRPQLDIGNHLVEKGINEILEIIDRGSQEVKRITTNARPLQLSMGLRTALSELIRDFSSNTGITFELQLEDHEVKLDETSAMAVFRIVQESITNIARHSGAEKAWLSLTRQLDRYHLKIADNGSGFDLSAQRLRSLGLTGIRERVISLRGELSIQSQPGQGTSIQVSVPAQL